MARLTVREGDEVFLADGDVAFGAVRYAPSDRAPGEFTIYVEDAGDFLVPLSAVTGVHSGKVILDRDKLGSDLLTAIRHAHDEEHEDRG